MKIIYCAFMAVLGLCVGSFCNVLIFRVPRREEFVKTPSHCMECGHRLGAFELIPVLSFVLQGGKCRACGARLSPQYPLIEGLNGAVWLLAAVFMNDPLRAVLCTLLFSALCVIALIDWRTFEIPNGMNLAVFILGIFMTVYDHDNLLSHVIGLFAVSLFFLLLWFLTGGKGIGLGDVKLMAGAGLFLGWQSALLALIAGSVSGAVIHLIRMRRGAGKKLAFGPYLAFGIALAAFFGGGIISWYLSLFGL